jgi:subtilase family serine protease
MTQEWVEQSCTDTVQIGTQTIDEVQQNWKPVAFPLTLKAGNTYYFDLWGKKQPKVGPNNVDAVPKIAGYSLPYAWWNSSWQSARLITITNVDPVNELEKGYTLNITIDTTGDKFMDDGNDTRIAVLVGGEPGSEVWLELNRTGWDWNQDNTTIWFRTIDNITASNDTSYYLYYNNPSAGALDELGYANKKGVYYAYEGFEEWNWFNSWDTAEIAEFYAGSKNCAFRTTDMVWEGQYGMQGNGTCNLFMYFNHSGGVGYAPDNANRTTGYASMRLTCGDTGTNGQVYVSGDTSDDNAAGARDAAGVYYYHQFNGGGVPTGVACDNQWHLWELVYNVTEAVIYFDGALKSSSHQYGSGGAEPFIGFVLQHFNSTVTFDDILFRLYNPPALQPFTTLGAEQGKLYFDPDLTSQTVIFDPEPNKGVLYYDANCTSISNATITFSDNASGFDIDSETGVISWEPTEADIGSNSFEITCSDGNTSTTENLPVTVTYVTDLATYSETIYFSNTNPQAGDTVTITARVFNFGAVDASNVPVSFYNETTLIGTTNIASIPKDSYAEASIQWVVPSTSCYRVVSAAVDVANNIMEEDELNNNASRYILVGTSGSGGIEVDNQTISPASGTAGSVVTVSGDAWYDTTCGWGEKVAGAFVNISIGGFYAGNGRTIADGTFSVAATVPYLTAGSHNVTITVFDGTFEQQVIADFNATNATEGGFSVTVPCSPSEQKPDPAVTSVYSEPSIKILDNMTDVKLKAGITNYGQEVVTDANVSFYDNGVFQGSTLVTIQVGSTNTTEIAWNLAGKGNTTRTITVVIDPYPDETTTGNNARTTIPGIYIHLNEPHKADFRVDSITFSEDNPYENDNVTITADLENIGIVDATADVLIWDEYDDYGVYTLMLIENTTAFIPDGTATVSTVYAFAMSNYPHNVTVELDPYSKVDEINEEDNNLTRQITIKQRSYTPDFIADSITFSGTPIIGQEINITSTIRNIGTSSDTTEVGFFSNDEQMGTNALYVAGYDETNTTSIYYMFNTSGTYVIKAAADPNNQISELPADTAEVNNNLSQQLRIYSDLDLAIYSPPDIEFSTEGPLEGENLTISATVENVGNNSVSNFNVSADRDGGITYDIEPQQQEVSFIGVGENYTVNFTWANVNGEGSHVIRIEIDPELSLDEPHANNTATRAIVVDHYADFRVFEDDIAFSPTPEYQQPTNMNVTVYNNGSDEGNATALIYVNSQYLYNQTITLAANVSTDMTTEWTPNAYDNTISVMLVNVQPGERNSTDNTAETIVHFLSVPYLIQNIPDITFDEDLSNTTNLSQYFADDDPAHATNLNFSYETNDFNISITVTDGIANVSAAANWNGYALVNFTANDSDQSMNQSNEALITVIPINDAPQVDSFNVSSENGTYTSTDSEVTFSENETAAFEVEVSDAEEDTSQLWYEWFLDGILKLFGLGKTVFEWAFDFEDAGEYNVTVVVNDSSDEKATQEWNVTVENLNRAPYFVDAPASVGQELNYQVNCSDDDDDAIYYYDDAAHFDIGLNTGLITWTPAANDVGLLTVNIICGDAEANQTRDYYIKVT